MNIYLDTEFNGFGGQLISIGMISEDGRDFYMVRSLPPKVDPWVAANVIPILGQNPVDVGTFKTKLRDYLAQFDKINIIADWPDDIKYFCEALILGPGIAMHHPPITFELRRDISGKSQLPHHALADAKGIRLAYLEKTAQAKAIEALAT